MATETCSKCGARPRSGKNRWCSVCIAASRRRPANGASEWPSRPRPERCEVCGDRARRIVQDHDHATGKFRGWLCDRCNRAIGHASEDGALLAKLAAYMSLANDSTAQTTNATASQTAQTACAGCRERDKRIAVLEGDVVHLKRELAARIGGTGVGSNSEVRRLEMQGAFKPRKGFEGHGPNCARPACPCRETQPKPALAHGSDCSCRGCHSLRQPGALSSRGAQ